MPPHNCCSNYTRSQLMRAAAAEAGKGLPAIENGMPVPAGHRALAPLVPLAQRRTGARGLRRRQAPARRLRGGHRPRRHQRPHPGLDLLRRRHRLDERAGADRPPPVRGAAPDPGAVAQRGHRLQRGHSLRWHPAATPLRPCTARARSRPSRRSATPAPTSPTSPRATSTRSASSRSAPAPAGSAATSTARGTDDNPLQGLSLDGSLSPSLATATMPVAAVDDITDYDMYTARRRRPVVQPNVQLLRALRRLLPRTRPT